MTDDAKNKIDTRPMTPDELRIAMRAIFGDGLLREHYYRKTGARLECSIHTVRKWALGQRKIPGPAKVALGFLDFHVRKTRKKLQ